MKQTQPTQKNFKLQDLENTIFRANQDHESFVDVTGAEYEKHRKIGEFIADKMSALGGRFDHFPFILIF